MLSFLEDALNQCQADEDIYIIGGASLYKEALPIADRLCITEIEDDKAQADTFFPAIDLNVWQEKVENAILQTKSTSTLIAL